MVACGCKVGVKWSSVVAAVPTTIVVARSYCPKNLLVTITVVDHFHSFATSQQPVGFLGGHKEVAKWSPVAITGSVTGAKPIACMCIIVGVKQLMDTNHQEEFQF